MNVILHFSPSYLYPTTTSFFPHLFPDFTLLFSAFSFIYFVFSLLASFVEAREPYSIRLFSLLAFDFLRS